MNWRLGLRRISAVWWTFCGLALAIITLSANMAQFDNGIGAGGIGYLIGMTGAATGAAYGMHRLTCWIIDGFTQKA